jgi:pyrroloquinoline quinone (PQQ) biosynthesis protein C
VRGWATTAERQRKVFEALAFKLEMLWAMIDTIHNAYAETSHPSEATGA